MKKKKSERKKMSLAKETLAPLEARNLEGIVGAAVQCQESNKICSVQHTCVSCQITTLTSTCA
ncbi:MAG TPA: class I lanthipeptide [Thermoanaerobaculia bacterium]|nr:class I lanthipeptide [Thermoanaerobaculia bacterium]